MNDKRESKRRNRAVALGYDPLKNDAPHVVAKGSGLTAERIIELAEEKNIELYEDAALVEALSAVDIGAEIPQELYRVVAEVLAFIYALDHRLPHRG